MPVILQQLNGKSGQTALKQGLEKVYQDYAQATEVKQLIDDIISNQSTEQDNHTQPEGQTLAALNLYGGWFNDALIAAVILKPEGHNLWLEHLCVRRATRRRGVARQMLQLLHAELAVQGRLQKTSPPKNQQSPKSQPGSPVHRLRVRLNPADQAALGLFQELGYHSVAVDTNECPEELAGPRHQGDIVLQFTQSA